MTILDLKKFIVNKLKSIIKDWEELLSSNELLNETIHIQVYDNLPYER